MWDFDIQAFMLLNDTSDTFGTEKMFWLDFLNSIYKCDILGRLI